MQVCVVKGYPKWFWIITFTSATIYYCKNFKMVIYIKSTILKLEKKLKNILEILFLGYIEHVKFQEASFNSNWDIKWWNKKFWINTITSPWGMLVLEF